MDVLRQRTVKSDMKKTEETTSSPSLKLKNTIVETVKYIFSDKTFLPSINKIKYTVIFLQARPERATSMNIWRTESTINHKYM